MERMSNYAPDAKHHADKMIKQLSHARNNLDEIVCHQPGLSFNDSLESELADVISTLISFMHNGGSYSNIAVRRLRELADRIRVQLLLTAQYAIAVGLLVFLLSVREPPQAFSFAFLFGMLVGGALSLPTLLLAAYFGRGSLGAIAGVLQMTRGLSLGSGPLVAAVLYDATGAYGLAFTTFAFMCLGSVVMMALARRPAPA